MGLLTPQSGCPAWPAPRPHPGQPHCTPALPRFVSSPWLGSGLNPAGLPSAPSLSPGPQSPGTSPSGPLTALLPHIGGMEGRLLVCGPPVSALPSTPISSLSEPALLLLLPAFQISLLADPLISLSPNCSRLQVQLLGCALSLSQPSCPSPSSWMPGLLQRAGAAPWWSPQPPQRPICPLAGAPLTTPFLPKISAKENH